MSHELRSPLNAILGFAQLMAIDAATITSSQKAQKASIDQILLTGWYLLELINGILDLAQIESGKLSLSLEEVSLPEVMVECQTMIEPQCQTRGIRMSFCQFELPCFVHADRTRLKQVVINLLSNAVKYNRAAGSVTVECTTSTPERVRISVRDTGAGLPPDKLAQLFEPFNRLGQETGAEEGTGIGLVTLALTAKRAANIDRRSIAPATSLQHAITFPARTTPAQGPPPPRFRRRMSAPVRPRWRQRSRRSASSSRCRRSDTGERVPCCHGRHERRV